MFGKKNLLPKPDQHEKVADAISQLENASQKVLEGMVQQVDAMAKALNTEQVRCLNYFWNSAHQRLRNKIPFVVLAFLECDALHPNLHDLQTHRLRSVIWELQQKGYITKTGAGDPEHIELTKEGAVYLTQKHPTVLMYWERLLELTPGWVSFLAATVGFVASVFGIIQFVDWINHSPH